MPFRAATVCARSSGGLLDEPITGPGRIDNDTQFAKRTFLPQGRFGQRRTASIAKTDKPHRLGHGKLLILLNKLIRSATAYKHAASQPPAAFSGRIGLQIIRTFVHHKSRPTGIKQSIIAAAERRTK